MTGKKTLLVLGTAVVIAGAVGLWLGPRLQAPDYQTTLEQGFDDMIDGIETAERHLTSLVAMAPPKNSRDLTDGYRYLMGHILRVAQSELHNDPLTPRFERAVTFLSKWTGDNPDNLYLIAPIDGAESYRISGKVPFYRGNDARTLSDVAEAPGLVLFQTITHLIGDTGSLQEMDECRNQTFADLNSFDLQTDEDGGFEILLAPQRPDGYRGNWLATAGELVCRHRDGSETREFKVASNVAIREIFIDWDEEYPLELDIQRLGHEGETPVPVSPEQRADQMRAIGEKVANQVKFWNGIMRLGLEAHGDLDFDGKTRLPVNGVNPPAPPFLAGGTAGAQQLYASGMYDLNEDEALILLLEIPEPPAYLGFQLGNVWMESLDQANYVSSRNQSQMEFDRKGNSYLVVAHHDPGVHNWIDTTGLPRGQMTFRFWYTETPPPVSQPVIRAKKVPLHQVMQYLDFASRPDPRHRRKEIALRQKHIRQRFRDY